MVVENQGCMSLDALDERMKKTFWYFLRGAERLMYYWNQGNYGTVIYGNNVGTFLLHYKCPT